MQHVNCNLCNRNDTCLVEVQNNYNVVECRNCGLVYVNPRPDQDTLFSLYAGYHQRNGKDERVWGRLMKKNFREVSSLLNRMFPAKGHILDIGCGYGHFIEIMSNLGWTVLGVDPSPVALNTGKKKN
ncbi:MAG: class I SAM-dependent methyltransferase [Planctomycetes bacterium]|nr:class I SAM-dependent methyltransferase [Planctomycetota bacterium]